ncbi:palmitoyltransferase ZDHHC20-B-like isoform X2 [Macrosteles quadrilineatus]|uniref:palmitoyltransferase ZDHHC20-B-like isoform X2 n=1 Tax=Macrosteles quadrilineatus TaxID=74068 RepID=UPI0023E0A0EB|nr:palmitoyltransferase ZDHHC20-B-like isoform X2 [Macrosteles quadrilineatus]
MATGSEFGSYNSPCGWCVKAVKWIPVLFIVCVIIWSYYAYVVQLCLLTVPNAYEMVLYLIGYHIAFVVFVWAYYQTVFTPIGTVPRGFKLPKGDLERLLQADSEEQHRQVIETFAASLPITNRTVTGAIRYCEKCQQVKPDRAHHCSVCGTCVLKMDHHCPWVNNCVSFTNYKFFILFLGYALVYCIYIVLTSLQYFIHFWRGDLTGMGRFHILFLFFVAAMFSVSLVSLFCYHCYLVAHNRSTLEAFRAPIFRTGVDKNGFSLGAYNNFQEVFGDNRSTWFLPIFTSLGDGIRYPVRSQHHNGQYNSVGVTVNSLGDGVVYPQRMMDEATDQLLGGRQHWSEDESPTHTHSVRFPSTEPAPV